MIFDLALALAAALAGAIAAIAGFGIGSLLTPLVALRYGTRLAVAAVSVPHFIGTAFRLASLWRQIDRRVLVRFGILSAAGGLAGAWLHSSVRGAALTLVLAALLIFAGGATLSGLSRRLRFGRRTAWVAGAVSGLFGGLVGNQGGIRAAALLGFDIDRQAFVATSTAVGIVVDAARMPVYLATEWHELGRAGLTMVVATLGVLVGTVWGVRLLRRIPEAVFRPSIGGLLLLLGLYMLVRGFTGRS